MQEASFVRTVRRSTFTLVADLLSQCDSLLLLLIQFMDQPGLQRVTDSVDEQRGRADLTRAGGRQTEEWTYVSSHTDIRHCVVFSCRLYSDSFSTRRLSVIPGQFQHVALCVRGNLKLRRGIVRKPHTHSTR